MAERSTFSIWLATRFFVNRKMLMAAPAFLPRMRSITRRAFWGDTRMYLAVARASIVSPDSELRLCSARGASLRGGSRPWSGSGSHARCLLRRHFHTVTFERPGRRELSQLVAHHILS